MHLHTHALASGIVGKPARRPFWDAARTHPITMPMAMHKLACIFLTHALFDNIFGTHARRPFWDAARTHPAKMPMAVHKMACILNTHAPTDGYLEHTFSDPSGMPRGRQISRRTYCTQWVGPTVRIYACLSAVIQILVQIYFLGG